EQSGERRRKSMILELETQVGFKVRRREEAEFQLEAGASRLEVLFDSKKRMPVPQQFLGPIRHDDEDPHRCETARHVPEQIDRRHISPVDVVEKEEERLRAGGFPEK